MFLDYFKLAEEPFGVTPDPRFLFLSEQHREAMASLAYGTESNRGFLALIAKPGMGKTSLLYNYLEGLRGKARTAFVFRTDCDSRELMRHILLDLGAATSGNDLPGMHDTLNRILMEQMNLGKRFVLVVDEAQNLDEQTLESVRLLSNFETPWKKLMQIVIAGQPNLAEKLARPSMTQFRQRISLVMRLESLNDEETSSYIDHRLWVAGCEDPRLFTAGARAVIAKYSEGIPRNINNICFNAMSLACALQRRIIDREMVLDALADLDLGSLCYENNVDSKGRAMSAAVRLGAAEKPRLSAPWRWLPRMIVGCLTLLVLSGVIGDGNHRIRPTAQATPALPARLTFTRNPSPATLEKPSVDGGKISVNLDSSKASRGFDKDGEIPNEIGTLNAFQSDFGDVRQRERSARPSLSESVRHFVDPGTDSRSAEVGGDE